MPTHYPGTPRERRALDAWIKLNRATDTIGRHLGEQLAGDGTTHAHMAVLEALRFVGPMCQADIGRKLLRGGANITELVDALEARGLVARRRDVEDRRRMEVFLTSDGEAAIDRIFPAHATRVTDALGVLSATEQKELARLCKKLGLGFRGFLERRTENDP
jgi:MarR family transcriptional regulator, 2-MHQ and catechol-resistance regulon repressor